MVIEAIPEILQLKISIFGQLQKIMRDDCILATNSSSFNSREMIQNVEKRNRVLNTHYYIPPEKRCVELMSCGFTDPAIIDFLMEKTKTVGFIPIHVKKASTGLIFNRIWAAVKRESLSVLSEGVGSADDIDVLFKDFLLSEERPV
jgi:3-hydroxyacyl-CoA dehydrogenase